MKKILFTLLGYVCLVIPLSAQNPSKVFTSDIDNFWIAYDSIQKTNDFTQKIKFINELYISKGTKGLKAFMKSRNYTDSLWVQKIQELPKFWESIRKNTLKVQAKIPEMEKAIANFGKLYPNLKEAEMYFTIGGLRSGGTTWNNMVLIGSEIATGDSTIDISDFKNDWLKNVFKAQSFDNIVFLNIHEYVHTQQKNFRKISVLSACIREGSCDFITELVMERPLQTNYLFFGKQHADSIKAEFKKMMYSNHYLEWLYNGGQKADKSDLGYYVGYEICKSYYTHASNKTQAVKDIIELNYRSERAVDLFLEKSGFFTEKIDKKAIKNAYKEKLP